MAESHNHGRVDGETAATGDTVEKMSHRYMPAPIDTSDVALDDEIIALTEKLAKNTHDIWAQQRISEGWRFGESRNDTLKEHPGLVPYEDLSDEEQEYDRRTALHTLLLITALGYTIHKE